MKKHYKGLTVLLSACMLAGSASAISYTHLTLPTIGLV